MRHTWGVFVLLALAGLAGASERLRASAHGNFVESQTYQDVYYLPPRAWLPVVSLGWDEALADLIWMRALVYYGDQFAHRGRVEFVHDYVEAMEELDPNFVAIYRWVGTAGLYRPQAITPADVERTLEIMERGAERHPDDGDLAWDIGAVLVFELPPMLEDVPGASDRARERGMPYLMTASRLGAAPEWAALSNASILARIGRTDQAARHLEEMYLATDDPATRERMEAAIRDLRQRTQAEAFLATIHEMEEDRRRHYPYLSPDLYILVGERPPDPTESIRVGLPAALAADALPASGALP